MNEITIDRKVYELLMKTENARASFIEEAIRLYPSLKHDWHKALATEGLHHMVPAEGETE